MSQSALELDERIIAFRILRALHCLHFPLQEDAGDSICRQTKAGTIGLNVATLLARLVQTDEAPLTKECDVLCGINEC